jgi:tetratricopeptide (TPR) repeat protein
VLGVGSMALTGGIAVGIVTRPKPDLGAAIRDADGLIEQGEYSNALDVLNERVLPVVSQAWVAPELRGRYHQAVARSVYFGQRDLGIRHDANDETVRREYLAAEDAGVTLTPDDIAYLCDTYVALGQEERALSRVMKLPDSASAQRRTIMRRLVEHELGRPRPEFDRAIQVLTAISADPDLSLEDRAWSLARETEVRVGQGYVGEAVARLLQGIMRLEGAPGAALAELYALLGEAYYQLGEYETAVKQLERAAGMLAQAEPLAARVGVYLGMCEQSMGRLSEARDRYSAIVEWSDGMEWHLAAQLGLGETEGMLGRIDESVGAYSYVVEAMLHGQEHALVTPDRVAASLLRRAEDRMTAEDPQGTLRFVLRAEQLFSLSNVPPGVLRTLAEAHRMLAERTITESAEPGVELARQVRSLDPATREAVQRHYVAAAGYYARHASAVLLTNNEAYVESLWAAALAYDAGGDYERAIATFREYIDGVPDDPSATGRQATRGEARYRLGRAYQARGEHALAADVFEALLADGESGGNVGQYAEDSHVPLAQAYLADDNADNDAQAKRLLEEALSGRLGGEGSVYFHDALLELAALHHRTGEHLRAIERLTEALSRYPDDQEAPVLRYRLGDSLRQEAGAIERTLAREAMPDAEIVALTEKREAHLLEALRLFGLVRDDLGREDAARMSESRRVALRNSYFFLGDCAFDLGDYESAVRHYETARERYSRDPASLVAMVQIVNAYVAMGQLDRAKAANERARRFYASLPEDAWEDPYLPMNRADWERWLDSTAELYGFGGD